MLGDGGTPYNCLYGETPPERVGISPVEVQHEGVRKSFISVCKKAQKN